MVGQHLKKIIYLKLQIKQYKYKENIIKLIFIILGFAFAVSSSVIADKLKLPQKTKNSILLFDLSPIRISILTGILSSVIKIYIWNL